jgi:hypothetical protein
VLEAKNPKSILQLRGYLRDMLFDAVLLMDANVFETFSTYLQQVADAIEQHISKESFGNTESEVIFLNHMKRWIAAMISFLEAWEAIQELYDEMEISCSKQCFYTKSTKPFCFKTLPWPHFASNRANARTHNILAEAEKKGLDVNFRLQRLPRGCITIVELWRKDVSAVVESILQVSVFRSSCGSSHETLSANQYADQ